MTESKLNKIIKWLWWTLFLVWGAVRDSLLWIEPNDKDYVITWIENIDTIPFEKVAWEFFPVFLVRVDGEISEIALARKEKSCWLWHKDFSIIYDSTITIEDDLSRRDLTINAIARNIETGEIIDPFNWWCDLENWKIRHVSPSFSEDPLRVFRVARFCAKFKSFKVCKETTEICKYMKDSLKSLSIERVFWELVKAMSYKKTSRFFTYLDSIDCLNTFFKEVSALKVPDMHDWTSFDHVMRVMDQGKGMKQKFWLLCHDFWKWVTPEEHHPSHHWHDKLWEQEIKNFCKRLKTPRKLEQFAIKCSLQHMRIKTAHEMRLWKLYRLLMQRDFLQLLDVSFIDSAYRDWGDIEKEINYRTYLIDLRVIAQSVSEEITWDLLISEWKEPCEMFWEWLLNRRIHCFIKKVKKSLAI